MVFHFCFQVPMWLPCPPMGLNHWGLQYCNPMKYTLGRHMYLPVMIMANARSALSGCFSPTSVRESFLLLIQLSPAILSIWGHTALGSIASLYLPYMAGLGHLFQVGLNLMALSTLKLQWALNPVLLMWWLGIRLMNLMAPVQLSASLLNHTFILVSWVRCPH